MKRVYLCAGALLLALGSAFADKETTIPGQQVIVARRTRMPVVVDGVLGPAEWSAAIPLHVNAVKPQQAPGLVPWAAIGGIKPPDNQDDSSFTIYAMYDGRYLYVAVDVTDDELIADALPGYPFLDDVAEIYIDGDNQPYDLEVLNAVPDWFGVAPNNEGFQLDTSVNNVRAVYPWLAEVDWDSQAGLRPRGFLVEARIALDSINTIDNSWWTNPAMVPPLFEGEPPYTEPAVPGAVFSPVFRRPYPGDSIGFNVTVGDDDCGRRPDSVSPWDDSYGRTDLTPNPSSYIAWDGSSANWYYADEAAWGTLYFAP